MHRGESMNNKIMKMVVGDIQFQCKYGIYFLYIVISIFYIFTLSMLKGNVKSIVGMFLILSDPATMGMFFMGAIVLLEKSQRVLNSIAVSPVSPFQYLCAKICSIGIISTIVGIIIGVAAEKSNLLIIGISTLLASIIFSLCGLIVGAVTKSLNQYIVATMPFEIIGFVPLIAYLLGERNPIIWYQPCTIAYRLIEGNYEHVMTEILVLVVYILFLTVICHSFIVRMFQRVGGVKL
jgi:fluoroquinolone transport system permease protein